jgi:diaminopimelate decarboxylase
MRFEYKNNKFFCEEIEISEISKKFSTPFYLYSASQFSDNFSKIKNSFSSENVNICFAVKSCPNIAILKLLQGLGAGADTVSEGEIRRALLAGIKPEKIIFSGVGKTKEEISFALSNGIGQINAESIEELELVNEIAGKMGLKAKISIRVNPDVDAKTHEKITTGRKFDKFGIPWEEVFIIYDKAKTLSNIDIEGLACHIGSQITSIEPYKKAFAKVAEMVNSLKQRGFDIKRVDLGGGIGIRYNEENLVDITEYAKTVKDLFLPLNVKIFLEPGRVISANSGALIAEVQYIKHAGGRSFVIIDAGMNDLARPAVYGAYHKILPVVKSESQENYDIVGPVCESSDIFGRDRKISSLKNGDLVIILDAGAYGASMSSNYNTRPLISEILVEGSSYKEIRKRQSFDDMISHEVF